MTKLTKPLPGWVMSVLTVPEVPPYLKFRALCGAPSPTWNPPAQSSSRGTAGAAALGRASVSRRLGRAGRCARLDRQGFVRPPPAAGDAAPELQPPVSIRRDRTDLAAAGPAGRRADRGDRRDPELNRRPHDLPQAQQARARPSRREPRPQPAVRGRAVRKQF